MKRLNILAWARQRASRSSAGGALADTTLKMVEVITSPPRTEFLKKQIAEFETANPGVKVELVSLPWGQAFEKFLTMVQAGDTPDIVEMPERWMGLYANNGQLEDLGPYMANWADAATLGDRAKEFGSTVGGTQYMIPYGYYINALFWNKKLFKEAGLDGPPATLDDFVEDSKKISAIPGKYGYCLRGGPGAFNGMHMFMNIAQGKGGYFNEDGTSTINEEGSVKGLQMLADMYKNGLCAEGRGQLGLQRDRHRLLFRHLRHAQPGSGCADRHRREDERRRFRGRADAGRTERQVLPDPRLCRLGDVRQLRRQGR